MMFGVGWYVCILINAPTCANLFQKISYRLQNWRNAFASAAMSAVKVHIEESEMTPSEITEAVDVFLSPDGNPPSYPYFWRDWDIADDGGIRRSVWFSWKLRLDTF